jgi:dimethylglycine oxidase
MNLQRDPNTKIIILGAGIVGCNIADKLSELGMKNVMVLEKGPLFRTGGSSSHAPGLVFQTNGSQSMVKMAMQSVRKFSSLEHDEGPTYLGVGGIEVAFTPERLQETKRRFGFAQSHGIKGAKLLSPREVVEKIPLIDEKKIYGGYFVPNDGIAKALRICGALAKRATARGVLFQGDTEVLSIDIKDNRVKTVITDKGEFDVDIIVCCAGIWGPKIGKMVGVPIPLQPLEHQLVYMKPLEQLSSLKNAEQETIHPILRHQDKSMYFKQFYDTYVVGSYQHRAMPVNVEAIKSNKEAPVMPSMHPFTPQDFVKPLEDARDLMPALQNCEVDWGMNGMFSFTQDGMSIFGESSKVKGFWSAEAVWVTHSGGAGDAIAEWIALGKPSIDLREHHISRFEKHSYSPTYIRQRGSQNFIEVYDILHPLQPMLEPRPLRVSPFYQQQRELGAVFLEYAGWERPQWFEANKHLEASHVPKRDTWSSQFWSPIVGAEHKATRERVALFDMTPLKKLEVSGKNATALLDKLTTGKMTMKVSNVTYTLVLDESGGILSDVTVARVETNLYHLGINSGMDVAYFKQHAEAMVAENRGNVHVEDVTSKYCCLGVWGPKARDVVQSISEDDWSNEGHGFFKCKEGFVGQVPVRALRISYVGELGWELYTPYEYGYRLWNLLWQAGQQHGIVAAGRGAFDALRIEKGYRSWGKDMWADHDPFEAGLGFAVKIDKEDFVGKRALLERQHNPKQKLCTLTFVEPGKLVMGNGETVYQGQNVVGFVTSACYGYSVGCGVAYAWLEPRVATVGAKLQVDYFGEKLSVTVAENTVFDPEMTRMKTVVVKKELEAVK